MMEAYDVFGRAAETGAVKVVLTADARGRRRPRVPSQRWAKIRGCPSPLRSAGPWWWGRRRRPRRLVVLRPGPVTAVDGATADELGAAWRERRSVVIELSAGSRARRPRSTSGRCGDRPGTVGMVGRSRPGGRTAPPRHLGQCGGRAGRREQGPVAMGRAGLPSRSQWRPTETGAVTWSCPTGRPALCDGGPLDAGLAGRVRRGRGPPDLARAREARAPGAERSRRGGAGRRPARRRWPPRGPGPGSSPRPGRARRGC